jgi:hypothetical protein
MRFGGIRRAWGEVLVLAEQIVRVVLSLQGPQLLDFCDPYA